MQLDENLCVLRTELEKEGHDKKTDALSTGDDRGCGGGGMRGGFICGLREGGGYLSGQNGRIAYLGYDGNDLEIYTINLNGSGKTQVTNNTKGEETLAYSPNSKRIAYSSWDGHDQEIFYTIKVGGGGKTQVTNNDNPDFWPSYSPDGKKIAYTGYNDVGSAKPRKGLCLRPKETPKGEKVV
jgi:hypothetical protein